jgi:hypothetical protein
MAIQGAHALAQRHLRFFQGEENPGRLIAAILQRMHEFVRMPHVECDDVHTKQYLTGQHGNTEDFRLSEQFFIEDADVVAGRREFDNGADRVARPVSRDGRRNPTFQGKSRRLPLRAGRASGPFLLWA